MLKLCHPTPHTSWLTNSKSCFVGHLLLILVLLCLSVSVSEVSGLHHKLFDAAPSSYASPETTEFKNFNRNPHPYASPDASDLSSSSRAPHPYSISSNKPLPSSITSPAFDSSISSPISSPVVVDRTRLVGLGELATPRWTSNALRASREGEEGQQANRSHIPSSGYWNASPTSFASPTAPRGPKHRSQASIHLPISSPLAYGHSSQENHSTVSKKKGKTHGSTSEAQLLSPTQHHGSGTWEDDVLVAYAEKDEVGPFYSNPSIDEYHSSSHLALSGIFIFIQKYSVGLCCSGASPTAFSTVRVRHKC